ncbi:MAG: TIGR02281 family clan AA aspartic protease [Mariprofundaceae bacterium]|nr:TIGR02281 family clan AA aspartic protease [Mariprofundaceae bacterium]
MHKIFLLLLLSVWSVSTQATVYQWRDAHGHTHFSDTPHTDAKTYDVQPLHSIKNPSFNMDKQVLQLPYQNMHGSMVVKARINHVMMSFILDTGATLVVLSPAMAKQAHIDMRKSKTIMLQTANGSVRVPQVMIDHIEVGRWRQQHIQAAIQTVTMQQNIGLLGMSFLKAYRMSIDHQRHIITLEAR